MLRQVAGSRPVKHACAVQRLCSLRGGRGLCTKAEPARHPLPPFTEETAKVKVQAAEDAWNGQDAAKVSMAYSPDSRWRNRDVFVVGRGEIKEFLEAKWSKERDYRLKKHYFAHSGNRIAVTFQYEYVDPTGQHWRAYGNENWTFDDLGYMKTRNASINDVKIKQEERVLVVDNETGSVSAPASFFDGAQRV